MQSDLRVALLLQVGDDALTDKVGCSDDVEDFIIVMSDKSKLEAILCRVDGNAFRLC